MSASVRKTKMVSFRLSPAEYLKFREFCKARGVHSISDLARIAMENFAASEPDPDPLPYQISDLRSQMQSIARELDRIAKIVEIRKAAGI